MVNDFFPGQYNTSTVPPSAAKKVDEAAKISDNFAGGNGASGDNEKEHSTVTMGNDGRTISGGSVIAAPGPDDQEYQHAFASRAKLIRTPIATSRQPL